MTDKQQAANSTPVPAAPLIDYKEVLQADEDLVLFLRNVAKFEEAFCRLVRSGEDFTIKLEVNGGRGRLNHCRVYRDEIDRGSTQKTNKTKNQRE